MQWDDVRFFLAVARSGQLSKAAASLHVDATTVARRLRRLEIAVGQTLFERTKDGQVLSEAGEILLSNAEAAERAIVAIDASASGGESISGLIRISVSEGFGTWFVARHLHSFLTAFPEVRVDLVASTGFLNPSKRETDVAIVLARPRTGPLVCQKLAEYSLRLYGSPKYLRHLGRPISELSDLRKQSLIGYIPDLIYAPELRYLDEVAAGLSPGLRSTSINAQHQLVASGAGIGILPCFIGDADDRLLRVLPSVLIQRTFWLVTHEDTRRLARIEAFVEWLQQTVKSRASELTGLG